MKAGTIYPVLTWRAAVASEHGPSSPLARHILLTLSVHMNEKGGSCFPSISLLVKETGLSRPSLVKHLKLAVDEEWLIVKKHGYKGQNWARNDYQAAIPKAVKDVYHVNVEVVEGGKPQNERRLTSEQKVVNEVNSNSSYNSSKNSPVLRDEKSEYLFEDWWDLYGKKVDRKKCGVKWNRLSAADRQIAMDHTAVYVTTGRGKDKHYRRDPIKYLNNENWNDEDLLVPGYATKSETSGPDRLPPNEIEEELSRIREQSTAGVLA